MTDANTPADHAVRTAALDPGRSFIVQAPAGSGKTGLLTRRFLRLLATVDAPEEIIAITFTRKAAGEMRERIVGRLRDATAGLAPADDYEREGLRLARAVLARDRERGWNLVDNPSRLRVQTIDALCAWLVRQMPLASHFGALPTLLERPEEAYREAAVAAVDEIAQPGAPADALATVLAHLDNRVDRLQSLLSEMLARRDQWLRHIAGREDPARSRATLEAVRGRIIGRHLRALRDALPVERARELLGLARAAASNVAADHWLAPLRSGQTLPEARPEALAAWHALARLLLTSSGTPRRRLTLNEGFPPGKGEAGELKRRALALLDWMDEHAPAFLGQLAGLDALPEERYADPEWAVIEALFTVMVRAAAHLKLVFRERGEVDYVEIAEGARAALGPGEAPTDLALRLDYRIRHLLVDEFQDTSLDQYLLLEALTAGWSARDGRTLFLVGDPMQSIYRFREAEVGLFLRAWKEGLGSVALTPLRLEANFRSRAGVVDWINRSFPALMPAAADALTGAVPYNPSRAVRPAEELPAVEVHCFHTDDRAGEAARVAELARSALEEDTGARVAILVRSRSHLPAIVARLGACGLRFEAVEVEALDERPVVQDLLALTRALLHPGDRVAWLALLRAPYCGLALADLHGLTGDDEAAHARTIPALLADPARTDGLSEDGHARLRRVAPVLEAALAERGRRPLREWVEGTWIALGGPACVAHDGDLEAAEVVLETLESLQAGQPLPTREALEHAFAELYAPPDPGAGGRLQVMTLHKAKGLEFDTVIVPGLGRRPRPEHPRLLYWMEVAGGEEPGGALVFAPIRGVAEEKSAAVRWIGRIEAERARHEDGRLLYVAITRARERVHLLGHAKERPAGGELRPEPASLLERLWPAVAQHFGERQPPQAGTPGSDLPEAPPPLRQRLVADWTCPEPRELLAPPAASPAAGTSLEFDWAGENARRVGVVVHRLLQRLGQEGAGSRPDFDLAPLEPVAALLLRSAGVPEPGLAGARTRVMAALARTLADPRGRWILAAHTEARVEYALTACLDGRLRRLVVDRTFVDEEGRCWVIDYKTGSHEGGALDRFIAEERVRYRGQLEGYRAALAGLGHRDVHTGLYFPMLQHWSVLHPEPG